MRANQKISKLAFIITCWIIVIAGQKTSLDTPNNLQGFHNLKNWLRRTFGTTGSGKLLQIAKNEKKLQDYYTGPFPCNVSHGRSLEVPTSINRLRPGDIDIICAIGDSISAGVGIFATRPLYLFVENRGAAFSGGGQSTWREFVTLPNILKEFNPNLIGYARKDSYNFEEFADFNVAEPIAMSRDMPHMTQVLIDRLKSDPRVDIRRHWKMIVLMIGANDICSDMCYLPEPSMTLLNHKDDLLKVLRLLKDNLPRTFVALVGPPNLEALYKITNVPTFCTYFRSFACSCLFGEIYKEQRQKYFDIMKSLPLGKSCPVQNSVLRSNRVYLQAEYVIFGSLICTELEDRVEDWFYLEEVIAHNSEFHTDDFTVEMEPTVVEASFPLFSNGDYDTTFLSADCFHVSQKSHSKAATGLWNNLLQPFGERQRDWNYLHESFLCPTEKNPYLKTLENSKALFDNYPRQ